MAPGACLSRAALPGISSALPQVPLVSLTTNAWVAGVAVVYEPPALQLPADGQDTELTVAYPPPLSVAVPGTSFACPQVPPVSLATKAWNVAMPSTVLDAYWPPAAQFPGAPHDIELTLADPPALRAPEPGISLALPQVPLVCVTTNACWWPEDASV